jgi:hypothetical protein
LSKPYKYHCQCGAPAMVKWVSIKKFGETEDVVGCTACGKEWRVQTAKGAPVVKRTHSGSGQIAGRITVGAGFRWGSTRLG